MSVDQPTVPLANSSYLPENNFFLKDLPDETKWADCVHCGMCLETCPTYQETAKEHLSPRGRIHLIRAVAEGRLSMTEIFSQSIFSCLSCRACTTQCPSSVQVGSLVEEVRAQIRQAMPLTGWKNISNQLFLKNLFSNPNRLQMVGSLLAIVQKMGLQSFAEKSGALKILPSHLQEMENVLPKIKHPPVLKKYPEMVTPYGHIKGRVAMLTGCVMDVLFSDINEATINVLIQNGYEVALPKKQRCCGALFVHAGDRDEGRKLAKQNIEAFQDYDQIIVNAGGCGAMLIEYPELFKDDPVFLEKAEQFSAKVVDITKFLMDNSYRKPKGELKTKITYHDSCHLAHVQGVRKEPRQLLEEIPGVELVNLPNADRCCGSAGIYNITNPNMANALLDRKINDIPESVEMITMGNPGCMLQLAMGVLRHGRNEKVVHTVQLLDWSYQKETKGV